MDPTLSRVCTSCGGDPQPNANFPLTKRSDGAMRPGSWCIECRRLYAREYARERKNDPEAVARHRETDRLRRERLKDDPAFMAKERERQKVRDASPEAKEKKRLRTKAWAANNVERERARQARWRHA